MTIASSNPWITCPNPNPHASLRLFCFPYAGGGALSFRGWSAQLPLTVEVCPIELPGRGMRLREAPFTQLVPLVEAIAESLLPYLDKPFAFFGHSMGALVSFEVARYLCWVCADSPAYLFVSGRRAPQLPDPDPPIHALPEAEFIEELRRLNGTPETVLANDELMQLLLPVLRADFAVLETYTYQPEPPLSCPLAALGGLQDPDVSGEMLKAWQEQTSTDFSLQMFPGDHFFLHTAQPLLWQFLNQTLSRITNRMSSS
ncbi:thioesterase [Pleurocapsales cyanobacterium LEGE 06147]|nr:thioesterase [Pleurocapsales cyanobacterium LEGE 06147]